MKLSVLDFINTYAKFHSSMVYIPERKSFNLAISDDDRPGIYFILNGEDILKIGKADGKNGLKGRIKSYKSNLSSRRQDPTVARIYQAMTGVLKNQELSLYLLPLPPIRQQIMGYWLDLQMARSLEYQLSTQAKHEQHSMLLSGQD